MFAQKTKTSECAPAAVLEIVNQIAKLRAAKDERMPKGATDTMRGIEYYLNQHRREKHFPPIDYSVYQRGVGASTYDMLAVLQERFNVKTEFISNISQIPAKLEQGPILVCVGPENDAHAEVIIGVAGPHTYHVYNPLKGNRAGTIEESNITLGNLIDRKGKVVGKGAVVYATSP